MLSKVLGFSGLYSLFVNTISSGKADVDFFFEHKPGIKVLDVGCGPASRTHYFTDTDYTGVDFNPNYIEKATEKWSSFENIRFFCSDLNMFLNTESGEPETFDLIFMFGVLHHLNDGEIDNALSLIRRLLKPGGSFRTFDNVYLDKQSKIARWLMKNDRGNYVRTISGYEQLITKHFPNAAYELRDDLLRLPYNHIIFSAELHMS